MAATDTAKSTIADNFEGLQGFSADAGAVEAPPDPLSAAITSIRSIISGEVAAFPNLNVTITPSGATDATTVLALSSSSSTFVSGGPVQTITYPSLSPAITSEKNCSLAFEDFSQRNGIFCNWTWDQFLCWPPTPAGVLARMRCPAVGHGIDITKFAERSCLADGRWGGKPNDTVYNPNGWTNYTPCFKPDVIDLMQQIYAGGNSEIKFAVAERTRTLEIVGLMLSLCALLLSLIIFCNFRSLRNNRTKIHKNLFVAMVIQVIIRLTLYLDQAIIRGSRAATGNSSVSGIENTPYVCEASYVLLEYARTAMFMWMFIEGLYLHNVVTVTVFQGRFPHTIYSIIGWGVPVIMTALWAVVTAHYKANETCWWNYNLTPYYWILEGPRLTVILFNFFFLLNIIRVLVVKLRQSQTSDVEQVRKAVRAAAVLLPLLGITNLLHIIQAPINRTAWEFALWSYCTHFLTSFQGFFIAMIYCFLNGEVRAALLKSVTVYMSLRGHPDWVPRRASMFSAGYNTAPDTEGQVHDSTRIDSPPQRSSNGGNNFGHNNTHHHHHHHQTHHHQLHQHNSNQSPDYTPHAHIHSTRSSERNRRDRQNWMMSLCFRGQKNKCVMSNEKMPQKIFMTTKSNAVA